MEPFKYLYTAYANMYIQNNLTNGTFCKVIRDGIEALPFLYKSLTKVFTQKFTVTWAVGHALNHKHNLWSVADNAAGDVPGSTTILDPSLSTISRGTNVNRCVMAGQTSFDRSESIKS